MPHPLPTAPEPLHNEQDRNRHSTGTQRVLQAQELQANPSCLSTLERCPTKPLRLPSPLLSPLSPARTNRSRHRPLNRRGTGKEQGVNRSPRHNWMVGHAAPSRERSVTLPPQPASAGFLPCSRGLSPGHPSYPTMRAVRQRYTACPRPPTSPSEPPRPAFWERGQGVRAGFTPGSSSSSSSSSPPSETRPPRLSSRPSPCILTGGRSGPLSQEKLASDARPSHPPPRGRSRRVSHGTPRAAATLPALLSVHNA
jgi:hypothetical protein